MSVRVLASTLSTKKIFEIQKGQYAEKIPLIDTVPPQSTQMGRAAVSNIGHFLCLWITGDFQTCTDDGSGNRIDTAINYLSGQLIDGAGQRKLFADYIPFDLWLSPGRVRDGAAQNAIQPFGTIPTSPAPYPLFYPAEFEYLFSANSDILLDVRNTSKVPLTYRIVFHGIRILSGIAVRGAGNV